MHKNKKSTHHFYKLKKLNHGWIQEVISVTIGQKGINNRPEEVLLDDVFVIELFFQSNNLPTKP